METLLSVAQNLADNPYKILSYFAIFSAVSTIIMIVKLFVVGWAVMDCWKNEKDEGRRNIWIAIIIAGNFIAALTYFTLERIMKKGGKDASTFKPAA